MPSFARALVRIPLVPIFCARALARGDTRAVGIVGERIAAAHLVRSQHRVLERNVRLRAGEIDLVCIAPDGWSIVIVEVKARAIDAAARSFAPPEANITHAKRKTLVALARDYVRRRGFQNRQVRLDVVAVELPRHGPPTVRHHPDCVTLNGSAR